MKRLLAVLQTADSPRLILCIAIGLMLNSLLNSFGFDILLPILSAVFGADILDSRIPLGRESSGPFSTDVGILYARIIVYAFSLGVLALLFGYFARRSGEDTADEVECPYCLSAIPTQATRCAFCGSDVAAELETPVTAS